MHVWATPSLKLAVKKKLRHCLDTLRRGPKLIIANRYLMKLFVVESLKSIFFHVKSKMLVKLQVIDHYCYWQVFFCFQVWDCADQHALHSSCRLFFANTLKLLARFPTTGIISFTGCFPARLLLWFFVATWQNLRVDPNF